MGTRLPVIALFVMPLAWFGVVHGSHAQEQTTPSAANIQLPDLSVRVLPQQPSCTAAGLCSLAIHVLNEGDEPYQGPISVLLDLHAPAVLQRGRSDGPCAMLDYGKFRCDFKAVALAPGEYSVVVSEFLFLSRAFASSNSCASLGWSRQALAARERILAMAIKASGHSSAELSTAAGLPDQEASHAQLSSALLGRWGEGDVSTANDSSCTSIRITYNESDATCRPEEALVDGRCVSLAQWCPSNRQHADAEERCDCPAALPFWDRRTARCEAQAASLKCAVADQDPLQSCRCSSAKPVYNAGKGECVAVESTIALATAPTKPAQPKRTVAAETLAEAPANSSMKGNTGCAVGSAWNAKSRRCLVVEARVQHHPAPHFAPVRRAPNSAGTAPKHRPAASRLTHKPAPFTGTASRAVASAHPAPHCAAFRIWGPRRQKCVLLPVYVIGRILRPGRAGHLGRP